MPDLSEPAAAPVPSLRRFPWIVLFLALAISAFLSFYRLDHPVLWSDEADTALYARNLLRTGELTAWDGRNVIAFAGGLDLNENLVNDYMPAQQYYLAALGMKLFGDTAAGARAPFAVLGVFAVALVAWWTRQYFGATAPSAWPLPALLLASSPSFLPFMRNARYYAPGVFWTILLLALWSAAANQPRDAPRPPVRWIAIHAAAAIAATGLFTSQYLYGAAALSMLPVFFLDSRFRSRAQFLLLGTICLAGLLSTLHVLLAGSSTHTLLERRQEFGGFFAHWFRLLWWHLRDMGIFEFFAWPMLLPLGLPWLLKKAEASRPLARRALVLSAAFVAYAIAVSFLSPQTFHGTRLADMRYVVPLIAVGAAIAAAGLVILWRAQRWIAVGAATILVATNALYLGADRSQKRHTFSAAFSPVRSTLFDRLREWPHPPVTTAETVHDVLRRFPPGSRVWLSPGPLATTAMFYLPDYRYCGLLTKDKPLRADLAAALPEDVFLETASPDVIVITVTKLIYHDDGVIEYEMIQPEARKRFESWILSDAYRGVAVIPSYGFDETRPEIPLHLFAEPPEGAHHPFLLWVLARK